MHVISSEVRDLCHSRSGTHAFPTCAAHFSAFLIFHAARTLSGSLCSPPSPWGKAYDTGYAFLSFVFMPPRAFASCHPTVPFSRVQGRFLATLEMTIWGKETLRRVSVFRIDLPRRGSLLREGMKGNVRSPVLSYRHPERSRGIFFVVAVLCTYEVMIKSPRCFGCSSSDALRLAVVQGRFLALLEMTIRGESGILVSQPSPLL